MSGICGLIRFDGSPVRDSDLDRMAAALAHRGPDRTRKHRSGSVGIAHLLRRVTHEDLHDEQPLATPHAVLASDLRLDNRQDLAAQLDVDAHALRELADSALLLRAYARWGENCAEHLIGDFAFAIWDARKKKLVLGRDHMGQRQIFYYRVAGLFAFASETRALHALPEVPRVLSEAHLARHLFYYRGGGQGGTTFEGIFALPGATIMVIHADGATTSRRYWEPHADFAHENQDESYYVEAYRRVVGEAVACRIRRAVKPAGLFFSGGLGSGAIAALAGPALADQKKKLIAVTSVMPVTADGEKCKARYWAELCQRHMPHLAVHYATAENRNALTGMEKGFLTVDRMLGPNHYVTEQMFEQIAASGACVVMDGFGDDYTVNPRGATVLPELLRDGKWRQFFSQFSAWRRVRRQSVWHTIKADLIVWLLPLVAKAWRRTRLGVPPFGEKMPITPEFARFASAANFTPRTASSRPPFRARERMRWILRRMQDGPSGWAVPASLHGLEFTQPFHDKRVVELGLAIPDKLFLKDGRPRCIARAALADLYPPEFQDRLPTAGDGIGRNFRPMAERIEPYVLAEIDRMEKAGRLSRYFDFPRMRRMLTKYTQGTDFSARLALRAFMYARYVEWFHGHNR
jgi:asparagine synthase (glutamine-hydrolysing)